MGGIDALLMLLCTIWAYAVGTGRIKVSGNPSINDYFVKTKGKMMVLGSYVMLALLMLMWAIRFSGIK